MVNADAPFVLLDDARDQPTAGTRLYQQPMEIISAHSPDQIDAALSALDDAGRRGLHAAGYLGYAVGAALEPKLATQRTETREPLLWFGLFDTYTEVEPAQVASLFPDPRGAWVGRPEPRISRQDYETALALVQAYIAAGDIYQANLTFPCDVHFSGNPLSIYAALRARGRGGYGAIVYTGRDWLLSFSPELFFTLDRGQLVTKPMKGTAARQPDADADTSAAEALWADPKQRAENLMIVDLLRNDLSRVAIPGSVQVPALFEIERYPTVYQMTSTITATLSPNNTAVDVMRAMFPCGSVTGAPKIRAMEVIAEVERAPRGPYTGSIGRIDANGDAAFNVAIRTLHIHDGADSATLGLGSGIVADSVAAMEWEECLSKGAFVASPPAFDLIETMRSDPDGGVTLIDGHLARLKASAAQFGTAFNRHDVRNALQAATIRHAGPRKLRLMLSRNGGIAIEIMPLPARPDHMVDVRIVPLPVDPADIRLRHKTNNRGFYDRARIEAGSFEVLFTDPDGWLTEGSFTNLFVPRDGIFLTPPCVRGLLPGVFRAALLERGQAKEADLRAEDLADGFFIGNALRGLMAAQLIP